MQSALETRKSPVGVKIISILIGFSSLITFVAGIMRFAMKDRFSQSEPSWILMGFMIGIALYFVWLSIGLWKLRNKARIATLITAALIFSLLTANLVQHHIFPDLKSWWHYYLYPALFFYLLIPSVKKVFSVKKDTTQN